MIAPNRERLRSAVCAVCCFTVCCSVWSSRSRLRENALTIDTMSKEEQDPYVQERLESLHVVDTKLVSILNHSSSALANLTNLKRNASNKERLEKIMKEFSQDIDGFYKDLEAATIRLKKEIKVLDDRIGKIDANGITMSPIAVNKKATWAGTDKMKSHLEHIDSILS